MFFSWTSRKFRSHIFLQRNTCIWFETIFVRKLAYIEVDVVNFNSMFLSSVRSRKKWWLKETCWLGLVRRRHVEYCCSAFNFVLKLYRIDYHNSSPMLPLWIDTQSYNIFWWIALKMRHITCFKYPRCLVSHYEASVLHPIY